MTQTESKLLDIVKRANENGHYIVDIPDSVRDHHTDSPWCVWSLLTVWCTRALLPGSWLVVRHTRPRAATTCPLRSPQSVWQYRTVSLLA
jgi:hypothetical protein